ncbi:hypothetical protein HZC27_05475 [Candidatus Roizmanbacteria bacterium]|nr:hypothetical protein [Candidatus Roizmanbacteria bacterium]
MSAREERARMLEEKNTAIGAVIKVLTDAENVPAMNIAHNVNEKEIVELSEMGNFIAAVFNSAKYKRRIKYDGSALILSNKIGEPSMIIDGLKDGKITDQFTVNMHVPVSNEYTQGPYYTYAISYNQAHDGFVGYVCERTYRNRCAYLFPTPGGPGFTDSVVSYSSSVKPRLQELTARLQGR